MARADRIYEIINNTPEKRLSISDIMDKLAEIEGLPAETLCGVNSKARFSTLISATVGNDNKSRFSSGKDLRFKTFGYGEEDRGYISIKEQAKTESTKTKILNDYAEQLPSLIQEANNKAKEKIRGEISNLSWVDFESQFMLLILESLGFSSVELTQQTRDGGYDAKCKYNRGLVKSEAIVSAKHWKTKNVASDEVKFLRGIKGDTDTGIIFTSAKFTPDAVREAAPSQNQRAIVLIDGDLIVETCFKHSIGVEKIELPVLYKFNGFFPLA